MTCKISSADTRIIGDECYISTCTDKIHYAAHTLSLKILVVLSQILVVLTHAAFSKEMCVLHNEFCLYMY